MKTVALVIASGVLGLCGIGAIERSGAAREENAEPVSALLSAAAQSGSELDGTFVVHEWGTFTSFSGSDGARLEFRPLVENDLPSFVLDRLDQRGYSILSKGRIRARQRMETPITYFYTDRVRRVTAKVDFPQGLLTEFYPPVASMSPEYTYNAEVPGLKQDMSKLLTNSSLDWGTITLIPKSALAPELEDTDLANAIADRAAVSLPVGLDPEPELYTGDHYYYARETDSALVHVHRPKDPAGENSLNQLIKPTGHFFEKFLFYRGVGNFDLPLKAEALGQNRFRITNPGDQPLTALFLVHSQGGAVSFTRIEDLAAGQTVEVAGPESGNQWSQLREAMLAALQAEGLYEKEAESMVKTWQSSWFNEPGTRLLYSVPRDVTDAVLPLTITPAPQECIRVLIGRHDLLAPETERRLQELVQASAEERVRLYKASKASGSTAPNEWKIPEELLQMGRLAEPALVRVHSLSNDATVREEAQMLIAKLREDQRK